MNQINYEIHQDDGGYYKLKYNIVESGLIGYDCLPLLSFRNTLVTQQGKYVIHYTELNISTSVPVVKIFALPKSYSEKW